MRELKTYQCETCGTIYESASLCHKCENSHIAPHLKWIHDWGSERDWDGGHTNYDIYRCPNCDYEQERSYSSHCPLCGIALGRP
jgi:hypothetical protein